MPYKIKLETQGAYIQFSGTVSGDEVKSSSQWIRDNHQIKYLSYSIMDFLEITECLVSRYDSLLVAAHDHLLWQFNPNFKIAIVSTHEQVLSLAQLYKDAPLITPKTEIFNNLSDARQWACS